VKVVLYIYDAAASEQRGAFAASLLCNPCSSYRTGLHLCHSPISFTPTKTRSSSQGAQQASDAGRENPLQSCHRSECFSIKRRQDQRRGISPTSPRESCDAGRFRSVRIHTQLPYDRELTLEIEWHCEPYIATD
jgi:hypothetical protein